MRRGISNGTFYFVAHVQLSRSSLLRRCFGRAEFGFLEILGNVQVHGLADDAGPFGFGGLLDPSLVLQAAKGFRLNTVETHHRVVEWRNLGVGGACGPRIKTALADLVT